MIFLNSYAYSQNKLNDGDWKSNYVKLKATPQADFMIRGGDIDNLSFGWDAGFDPFSGKSTESHSYPWKADTSFKGTDMIMVPGSMGKVDNDCGSDGYSGNQEELMSQFGRTTLPIKIPLELPDETKIQRVVLQMFVDDFQSPVFCSLFEVSLNGKKAPFIEAVLNKLNQTGPIGKLITIEVPADFLPLFKAKELEIVIDDKSTGANDGFAVDFVKILINPKPDAIKKTDIEIVVLNESNNEPLAGAIVETASGTLYKTDNNGKVVLKGLTLGHHPLKITACGFQDLNTGLDAEEGVKSSEPFVLAPL